MQDRSYLIKGHSFSEAWRNVRSWILNAGELNVLKRSGIGHLWSAEEIGLDKDMITVLVER